MKNYVRAAALFVFTAVTLSVGPIQAEDHSYNNDPYFCYERFILAMVLLESIPEKSGPQSELNKFAKEFSEGIYAVSSEEYTQALRKLFRARRIWPEYFGTNFVIALIYENQRDYRTAAGYYKEYLNKLKAFESGEYPISGGVIRSITTSKEDKYDIAYELVKHHLDLWEINIDDISAPVEIPLFIKFILLFLLVYAAIHYFVLPYMKMRKRITTR